MFCSVCGLQLVENVRFCSDCGTQVGSTPLENLKTSRANSSLPWIIAIVSAFIALTVAMWVLLWVNIGNSNGNAALAQAAEEQRLESIEQRLESVERWFDSNNQRNESIEQRLGSIENSVDSSLHRIQSIEQIFEPPQEVLFCGKRIPSGGFLEHFIEPGQSLASIVQIYWPHNSETPHGRMLTEQLVAHVAETNNIANPEIIYPGTWLMIYEHPDIQQVLWD